MAANHSTVPIEREAHLKEVWDLYKTGMAITEIAKQLSYSRQSIHYDIRQLHKRWWQENLAAIDKHKMRELAKIDSLEAVAWDAWIASGGTHIISTSKKGTRDGEAYEESRDQQEELVGDPRFLERIAWCIDKRCKILGIDAPEKINLNVSNDYREWSDDRLRQRALELGGKGGARSDYSGIGIPRVS